MTYPAMPWVVILVVSMIYRVFVLRTKNKQVHSRAKSGLRARKPDISRWTTAGGLARVRGAAVRVEFSGLLAQGCGE